VSHNEKVIAQYSNNLIKASYTALQFSIAELSKEQGGFFKPKGGSYCRDSLCYTARSAMVEKLLAEDKLRVFLTSMLSASATPIEVRELRWREFECHVETAVRVLNTYEKHIKWSLTSATFPQAESFSGEKLDWVKPAYFVGSRRWMKSIPLLSLFGLLVAISSSKTIQDSEWKNVDEMEKVIFKLVDDRIKDPTKETLPKFEHVAATHKYWKFILENYDSLFRKKKMSHYWYMDKTNWANDGSYYSFGLTTLCSGDLATRGGDTETATNFRKLYAEWLRKNQR